MNEAFQTYTNEDYDFQQERKESGEELRSLRIAKGLSQRNIAMAIGSSTTTICNFEHGRYLTHWNMVEKSYRMFIDVYEMKAFMDKHTWIRSLVSLDSAVKQ